MKEQKHLRCKLINILVSFLLLSIFLTALLGVAVAQGDNITLELVGQIGGPTQAVAVQGNYAYVGVGLRQVVLDVSDPTMPTVMGTTEPLPNFVEDVTVSGTVAYVAAGGAGMCMLNISDPANPDVIVTYDTPGYAEGVAVDGKCAYIADGPYGLRIVDVSDLTNPTEVGFAYPLNYAFDVAIAGQYVYLAAAGAGLLVVNVSDLAHPIEIGTHDTPGYAYGVDVAENVVYIADGWEGLRVVNASDPAHPVEVGAYDTPGWAFGVDIVGSMAYVADAFGGLRVLDVSDPTNPAELGGFEVSGGHAGSVVVAGSTAFVADRNWGLWIVDVSNPVAPIQLGFYSPLGYARDVAVAGNYAYVAAATYGLRVVDISDPAHPVQVGAYDTQGYAVSVAVAGTYAYVAQFEGLHVVDISNPAQPTRVGFCAEGGGRDMDVVEGIAYVANEWGLVVIGLSDPVNPTQLGFIELEDRGSCTVGVGVSGDLAYVAMHGGWSDFAGLKIVDVSDPSDLKLIGICDLNFSLDVAVVGDYAYVADHECLQVVDVSEPTHPVVTGSCDTPGEACGIAVSEDTAYIADADAGLSAVDISDPTDPRLVASYNTPGYAHEVAVVGNHIYVADGNGGMLILEMMLNSSTVRRQSMSRLEVTKESGGWITPSSTQFAVLPNAAGSYPAHSPTRSQGNSPFDYQPGEHDAKVSLIHHPNSSSGLAVGSTLHTSASIWIVTSAADSGPGTLRWCLGSAHSGDTIVFDRAVFPLDNAVTIMVEGELLPFITQGNLTIDASDAGVILDGSNLTDGSCHHGLAINSDGNVIKGLQILHFPSNGVFITGSHNTIGGMLPRERNIISDNGACGVEIQRAGSQGNVVVGNYIGTDVIGTADLGNMGHGVGIEVGAYNNLVEHNLISGNGRAGVCISDWGSSYNTIVGNLIGTDASGTLSIPNEECGVFVGFMGASFNRIGGTTSDERNIISGNENGVDFCGPRDVGNLVMGNFIGTDISGTRAIGNMHNGISAGGERVFIGGMTEGERNVISGNGDSGITLGIDCNWVAGNYIGADASGTVAIGNNHWGVVMDGSRHNAIQANLISGNKQGGVRMVCGSSFNVLRGNCIGTTADGVSALPNSWVGVNIEAASNTVGGPYHIDGNTIAYNLGDGIRITSYPYNTIIGNSIHSHTGTGISISSSGNNTIYHNNIINNTIQAYDDGYNNSWDSGPKEGGNYWSEHVCKGNPSNGSQPYNISGGSNVDHYPFQDPNGWLIETQPPIETFDTGKGTYPSIMGTHNGTIISNHTITVSKLYTYPCSGTGGHSEHIRIYNKSGTLSEGHWNGYACDYHNITLTPSITLLKGHEYNYTIITGSYPQIHHTGRLEIDDGVITCTEFVDANGKVYYDWIPAIRLWA